MVVMVKVVYCFLLFIILIDGEIVKIGVEGNYFIVVNDDGVGYYIKRCYDDFIKVVVWKVFVYNGVVIYLDIEKVVVVVE